VAGTAIGMDWTHEHRHLHELFPQRAADHFRTPRLDYSTGPVIGEPLKGQTDPVLFSGMVGTLSADLMEGTFESGMLRLVSW